MKKIIHSLLTLFLLSGTMAFAQFVQKPLPYSYAALEPHIDAQTMEIHFSRHHTGYIKNLNAAIAGSPIANAKIEDILANVSKYSEAVRNNAGGHYNHELFWTVLTGNKTSLHPQLEEAIKSQWVTVDSMKALMNKAAATRFGSGWAWLYVTGEGKLAVGSSPNQDNPLMDVSPIKGFPILGIDVWEHAYYLKYQNKRGDYLNAIWNVVNWEEVSNRYFKVVTKKSKFDVWPALKAYRAVIWETYVAAQGGNMQPIKTRSVELMQKADALVASEIPKDLNKPETVKAVKKLKTDSKKLNDMVQKKASDEAIKKMLTSVYTTYQTMADWSFGKGAE
jgi:superoxide dismutase